MIQLIYKFIRRARRVEVTEYANALWAMTRGPLVVADMFSRLPPVDQILWVEIASPATSGGGRMGVLGICSSNSSGSWVPPDTAQDWDHCWHMTQFIGDRNWVSLAAMEMQVGLNEHYGMVGNPLTIDRSGGFYPEASRQRIKAGFILFLEVVEMLDCINVSTEYIEPGTKHRKKKRKPAPGRLSYHRLLVKALGQRTRSEPGDPTGDRPYSKSRGSTAHYGNCCPGIHEPRGKLFGRIEGQIWRNAHWAGNEKYGTIESELTLDPAAARWPDTR